MVMVVVVVVVVVSKKAAYGRRSTRVRGTWARLSGLSPRPDVIAHCLRSRAGTVECQRTVREESQSGPTGTCSNSRFARDRRRLLNPIIELPRLTAHLFIFTPRDGPQPPAAHPPLFPPATTVMNSTATFLSPTHLRYLSTQYPIYYVPRVELLDGVPDHYLALAVPVIAYWVLSSFFHLLDISTFKWLDKYRIHESEEVKSRNLVSRTDVLIAVIFQHIVQTGMGYWWMEEKPTGSQVDHVANMLHLAPTFAHLVTLVLGQQSGQQFLAERGVDGLYTLYWWAIPLAKFFFGM